MRRPVGKVIGVVVVVAALVAVVARARVGGSDATLAEDYYASFRSECPLEQRYSQLGPHEVLQLDMPSDDDRIGAVRVWYPSELEDSDVLWPVVIAVNASGTPASAYEPWFARLASWGLVVVGNEDPQTGTGETASLTLDAVMDLPDGCPLAGRLDVDRMGIVGFSQGGAGALAALTQYENGGLYRTIFTGSAAYPFLAENMGWHYDASLVSVLCSWWLAQAPRTTRAWRTPPRSSAAWPRSRPSSRSTTRSIPPFPGCVRVPLAPNTRTCSREATAT